MMRVLRSAPVFLLLAFACRSATAADTVIVCHGDSITAGANLADQEKYPTVLATLLPHSKVINSGIGGNTSSQGRKRFEKDVLSHKPNLVVLLFGTNDSVLRAARKYRVPVETYRENLWRWYCSVVRQMPR